MADGELHSVVRGEDPLPLWLQVTTLIRERIISGAYRGGFPSEAELREEFGVSRATIREAIRRLKEEGLLLSRRGSGTYIAGAHVLGQLHRTSYSLAGEISALGLDETSQVLRREVVSDERATHALSLEEGATSLYISRLRQGSDVPMAIDHTWLRLPDAQGLLDVDISRGSLYENLVNHCGVVVLGGMDRFLPGQLNADEAALLRLDVGTPVIIVERYSHDGEHPIEYRRTTIAGQRLSLSASWGYDRNHG